MEQKGKPKLAPEILAPIENNVIRQDHHADSEAHISGTVTPRAGIFIRKYKLSFTWEV